MTAGRLSDQHEHHTNFVQAVVGSLLGACNSGDSLDDYCGYIQNVVLEMEKRTTYVKAIGDELYRRLRE
ncbi:MAG TPA: hypothetical protein DCZ04_09795 [Syntrophorhabdus aromaticivorans]|nr:hypothetical protein [Syntrophorhabdus aromaticivorans]